MPKGEDSDKRQIMACVSSLVTQDVRFRGRGGDMSVTVRSTLGYRRLGWKGNGAMNLQERFVVETRLSDCSFFFREQGRA